MGTNPWLPQPCFVRGRSSSSLKGDDPSVPRPPFIWLWVKHRNPHWNPGNMETRTKTCAPYPVAGALAHQTSSPCHRTLAWRLQLPWTWPRLLREAQNFLVRTRPQTNTICNAQHSKNCSDLKTGKSYLATLEGNAGLQGISESPSGLCLKSLVRDLDTVCGVFRVPAVAVSSHSKNIGCVVLGAPVVFLWFPF